MKKMSLLVCMFLLMTAGATIILAGDYADLKFIGFSANGKYMAFEESGQWDGSGGDYATTYYIDVVNNKYAIAPSVFEWSMDSMKESLRRPLLIRYQRSVAAGLKRLNIVRGNTGSQVVAHLLTDWSFAEKIETETYFYTSDGKEIHKKVPNYAGAFLVQGDSTEKVVFNPWLYPNNFNTDEYYELTLKKTLSNAGPCEKNDDAYRIELTLQDKSHHRDLEVQVLQKDSSVPKARNCPYGYHIEQVYFYKDKLAVFLNMFSQGFEGPDMRYMAVTGELDYQSNPPGE